MDVPDSILALVRDRLRQMKDREAGLVRDLSLLYAGLWPEFRRLIQAAFIANFLDNIDQKTKLPVWDGPRGLPIAGDLTASFEEMVTAVGVEAGGTLDEELPAGFDEGYYTGLWQLAMSGVDLSGAEQSPGFDITRPLLLAAGFGGLSYLDRLATWTQTAVGKFERWMKAAAASGMTLDQTMLGADGIVNTLAGHVTSLGGNELHYAFTVGQQHSWQPYKGLFLGEMWMTREDALVCPKCMSLHKHMTDLQPVHDSHPNCRCIKVPIVVGQNFFPEDYLGFVTRFQAEVG